MERLNYKQLFLMRHGNPSCPDGLARRLNQQNLGLIGESVESIISVMRSKACVPIIVSSDKRIAIDSGLFLGDKVVKEGRVVWGDRLFTHQVLADPITNEWIGEVDDLIKLSNRYRFGGSALIMVGHKEFLGKFPAYYMRSAFGKSSAENFGEEYGSGVYFDLEVGECRALPFEKGA